MGFSNVMAIASCETLTLNPIQLICCDKKSQSQSYPVNSTLATWVKHKMTLVHLFPDIDVQSISSYSDSDGDDSDSDFYIVPLPDCFNPEFTLQYIHKHFSCHQERYVAP